MALRWGEPRTQGEGRAGSSQVSKGRDSYFMGRGYKAGKRKKDTLSLETSLETAGGLSVWVPISILVAEALFQEKMVVTSISCG